jgi:hypothetical protein
MVDSNKLKSCPLQLLVAQETNAGTRCRPGCWGREFITKNRLQQSEKEDIQVELAVNEVIREIFNLFHLLLNFNFHLRISGGIYH